MTGFSELHAQESGAVKPHEEGFLKRFGVAAKVGIYGFGLDFHTSLHPDLKARLGFSYLIYNHDDPVDFTADSPLSNTPDVKGLINEADLRFPNANFFMDFYPVKSGFFSVFCITIGMYAGSNRIKIYGAADDPFLWNNVVITPVDGKFTALVKLGNTVKPYLGIGLGRTIPDSRFGYHLDLGVVYQGRYSIESDYASFSLDGGDNYIDLGIAVPKEVLNWCPMISFSVSYRIK